MAAIDDPGGEKTVGANKDASPPDPFEGDGEGANQDLRSEDELSPKIRGLWLTGLENLLKTGDLNTVV